MSILSALNDYHGRLLDTGKVPTQGYTRERISYALVLSPDGDLLRTMDLRIDPKTPRTVSVPASTKRTGTTPRPFFLWDNSKFVLGLTIDKSTKEITSSPKHHKAFRQFHEQALAGIDDPGLMALLAFLKRRLPERYSDPESLRHVLDANLVFMLDGDDTRFIHDRLPGRAIWQDMTAARAGDEGVCLVTGLVGPIARIHPSIRGVMGAQSSGASLVSFNGDAFESYGNEQGLNSPVSEAVSSAYGASVNYMLSKDSGHRIQIGDSTTVFWADASGVGEVAAAATENAFMEMLTLASPDDDSEAEKIRNALITISKGTPAKDVFPDVNPETKCFLLGLAPAASRLSVRFWQSGSFGDFSANIEQHWQDLYIEPYPWRTGPAAWALLCETAVQRKAKNIPPQLGGEMMRSILTGQRYPRTLLSAVINRIRADGDISGRRVAIIKAVLQREARKSEKTSQEVNVSLNKDDPNPAYRLGRLFAVLEYAQRAALGKKINSTIRDKYFAAASSSPAGIFPVLMRGASAHLSLLRKSNSSVWIEKDIGEILGGMDGAFPRVFSLEDQGRFAIGYYHQRFTSKPKNETASEAGE